MDEMKLMVSVMLMLMVTVIAMVTVVRKKKRRMRRKGVKIQEGASYCCLPLYLPRGCSASTRQISQVLRVLVGLQVYSRSLPHFHSRLPTH